MYLNCFSESLVQGRVLVIDSADPRVLPPLPRTAGHVPLALSEAELKRCVDELILCDVTLEKGGGGMVPSKYA